MMRRRIVHVLLSLLLLVSQQMAFAHALSHWTRKLGARATLTLDAESDLASAVAQDGSCSQCLAFAKMGSAIGGAPPQFASPDLRSEPALPGAAFATPARTVCVFDSRAPPAFV